jgi:hypothetical protein
LPQQILWNKFHIRCAYFSPNCTWSLNYSVLVLLRIWPNLRSGRGEIFFSQGFFVLKNKFIIYNLKKPLA